ncbi:hypothetical protein MSAN_02298500 [Mycena sanguinolenta]|uniref:Uncharacterized protein n=1 Tax=Mycena sanguinolenta TaxID=230812 RepID=A0A8H6X8L4_9AGAR|nr:hypothetical protein MSAN_02298500 [Mycena sanguinolenta]
MYTSSPRYSKLQALVWPLTPHTPVTGNQALHQVVVATLSRQPPPRARPRLVELPHPSLRVRVPPVCRFTSGPLSQECLGPRGAVPFWGCTSERELEEQGMNFAPRRAVPLDLPLLDMDCNIHHSASPRASGRSEDGRWWSWNGDRLAGETRGCGIGGAAPAGGVRDMDGGFFEEREKDFGMKTLRAGCGENLIGVDVQAAGGASRSTAVSPQTPRCRCLYLSATRAARGGSKDGLHHNVVEKSGNNRMGSAATAVQLGATRSALRTMGTEAMTLQLIGIRAGEEIAKGGDEMVWARDMNKYILPDRTAASDAAPDSAAIEEYVRPIYLCMGRCSSKPAVQVFDTSMLHLSACR